MQTSFEINAMQNLIKEVQTWDAFHVGFIVII